VEPITDSKEGGKGRITCRGSAEGKRQLGRRTLAMNNFFQLQAGGKRRLKEPKEILTVEK